eukprot:557855-Amphidinium_carterae.1
MVRNGYYISMAQGNLLCIMHHGCLHVLHGLHDHVLIVTIIVIGIPLCPAQSLCLTHSARCDQFAKATVIDDTQWYGGVTPSWLKTTSSSSRSARADANDETQWNGRVTTFASVKEALMMFASISSKC